MGVSIQSYRFNVRRSSHIPIPSMGGSGISMFPIVGMGLLWITEISLLLLPYIDLPHSTVPGCPGIHPDLHPTAYQSVDSSEIRLILPVKGILPMGCAKGIPGYGMIHPNLINAAVLQCHGLSAANGYCDAMSLAPNFDLLLSQQLATDVARLIAEWDMEEEDLGDRADLLLQTPLKPSVVNMAQYRNCLDTQRKTSAQTLLMSEVAAYMPMTDEGIWLMPIMAPILQNQGTNTRAMYYQIIKCAENVALKPKLNEVTVQKTIDTVVNEHWLELMSDADLRPVCENSKKLKEVLAPKTKLEKDLFMWNYAGALIQIGEWRHFHSYEETWTMLASFWGMKAPAVVPTCTTWSTFHDQGRSITQGTYRRYYRYLESVRRSSLTAVRDSDAESVASATPMPPRKIQANMDTLLTLVDTTWYPNLHQGLDYLWTIMNESERESFLKGITTERTSTSMSTVVPMTSRSAPTEPQPLQPSLPQEEQRQETESTGNAAQREVVELFRHLPRRWSRMRMPT